MSLFLNRLRTRGQPGAVAGPRARHSLGAPLDMEYIARFQHRRWANPPPSSVMPANAGIQSHKHLACLWTPAPELVEGRRGDNSGAQIPSAALPPLGMGCIARFEQRRWARKDSPQRREITELPGIAAQDHQNESAGTARASTSRSSAPPRETPPSTPPSWKSHHTPRWAWGASLGFAAFAGRSIRETIGESPTAYPSSFPANHPTIYWIDICLDDLYHFDIITPL
jgi:hypothetical protein